MPEATSTPEGRAWAMACATLSGVSPPETKRGTPGKMARASCASAQAKDTPDPPAGPSSRMPRLQRALSGHLQRRVQRHVGATARPGAVQLRRLQAGLEDHAQHLVERRVLEDADHRHCRGQSVADRLGGLDGHAPLAPFGEDHADLVRARFDTEERIVHGAHAAQFDAQGHALTSARVALSGSSADASASPTSSIAAPSRR